MPTGKREVTDALIEAATELFAEHGPGAVSVRDIATRAGVNHGLVHRHFGSKDALVGAVLDRLVGDMRQTFAAQSHVDYVGLFAAVAERDQYWRVLARALLDGHTDWLGKGAFPLIAQSVEAVKAASKEDVDAQAMVAAAVAAGLGWLVFEPFVAAATGMGGTADERRKRMVALWDRFE